MLRYVGGFVSRHPFVTIGVWAAVAVGSAVVAPDPDRLAGAESPTLLPADSDHNRAVELLYRSFPKWAGRSRAIVTLERPGGLTEADMAFLQRYTDRLVAEASDRDDWGVLSPTMGPYHRARLMSRDGQAAMIVVNLGANFVTRRATRSVERIESLAPKSRPTGLRVELTGMAGIGRDYARAAQRALHRTTWVTITAVLVILVLVYRAPLAAMIPLASIGTSVFVALNVLAVLAWAGWSVTSMERIFTVVLLFGAGTDYALFWISRYREELSGPRGRSQAAAAAMGAVAPAVLASAGTTIVGLWMMTTADLVPTHNAGKVLGIVLAIALAAALTLVPAMASLMAGALFWPRRAGPVASVGQRHVWPRLAAAVVRRPLVVMTIGLAVLAVPVPTALMAPVRFDTLAELPAGTSSARGAAIAKKHFRPGELFPTTLAIHGPGLTRDPARIEPLCKRLTDAVMAVPGVQDVRSLAYPSGRRAGVTAMDRLARAVMPQRLRRFFVAPDTGVVRLEVILADPPFSVEAMAAVQHAIEAAQRVAGAHLDGHVEILAEGATPYMINIRRVVQADQRRVMVLAMATIWLVVLVLVRDIPLSLFMLAATLVTYVATLGVTQWVFCGLLGGPGIDWKVKLFLFVIIVAVGQDYNIFLVTRLFQEIRSLSLAEGTSRAIVRTGPVISSCGLIMAATLGSLWAGKLELLRQLGFALAAGILIDTFIVRPLLIPSFYLLKVRAWARLSRGAAQPDDPLAPA